ncbi:unnamed protein product [Ectocarpus sp. CCAP 1310/34]|nr:unnamed protein product [Ectocarpus sp. CCAP 1310/34]
MILVLLAFGAAVRQWPRLDVAQLIGFQGWLAPMKVVLRRRGFTQSAGIGDGSESTLKKRDAETLRNNVKCQLPGCSNPVHVDRKSNKVFDHCCRGHAIQHQNPLQPASQSAADISDFQQPCLLPGCKLMGFVDKTTGVSYDYCGKAHANEAAMRMSGVAPKMGSTTTMIDHSGLRAPSSGGDTFLPPCKHSGCTRPCAADAKTGLVHDVCQTHFSGAANSTTYIVAGGTSADSFAAMGGTVGIIKISSIAQAAPPPPSASSASGRVTLPSAVSSGQCQLDGCAKLSAIDTRTGERYDFCSRQHAQQAKNPGKAGPSKTGGSFSAVPGSAVCMLLGCVKPQAPGYDHCCKDHALAARKYIPMCTLRGCVKDAWFDSKRNQVKNLRRGVSPTLSIVLLNRPWDTHGQPMGSQ